MQKSELAVGCEIQRDGDPIPAAEFSIKGRFDPREYKDESLIVLTPAMLSAGVAAAQTGTAGGIASADCVRNIYLAMEAVRCGVPGLFAAQHPQ